jgi:hypothetical protein
MTTAAGGLGGSAVSIIELVECVFQRAIARLQDVLEHRDRLALHADEFSLRVQPELRDLLAADLFDFDRATARQASSDTPGRASRCRSSR